MYWEHRQNKTGSIRSITDVTDEPPFEPGIGRITIIRAKRLFTQSASGTSSVFPGLLPRQSNRTSTLSQHAPCPLIFLCKHWLSSTLSTKMFLRLSNKKLVTHLAWMIQPSGVSSVVLLSLGYFGSSAFIKSLWVRHYLWLDGKNICCEDRCLEFESQLSHLSAACP